MWSFLKSSLPVLVDWLPWNHTFGGNHNFNLIPRQRRHSLHRSGPPVPSRFAATFENLKDISPTLYFNVPRGFELLIDALRSDASLGERFFSRRLNLFDLDAHRPALANARVIWYLQGCFGDRSMQPTSKELIANWAWKPVTTIIILTVT